MVRSRNGIATELGSRGATGGLSRLKPRRLAHGNLPRSLASRLIYVEPDASTTARLNPEVTE
jgi:hypothetical protein